VEEVQAEKVETAAPGAFTRRVVCMAQPGRVFAAIEDDFHHFYVEVGHDGRAVTGMSGRALRFPRSSCPNALSALQGFVGLGLDAVKTGLDASWQCTHAYELARLAIRHAGRQGRGGSPVREYLVRVPDRVARRTRATLARDSVELLAWDIEGRSVVLPEPYAGLDVFASSRWPGHLDAEELEAAQILRRGVWLATARVNYMRARSDNPPPGAKARINPAVGACYSYQPSIEAEADSLDGANRRDFTECPERLLAELGLARAYLQT
jgi:hypothetical protein